MRLDPLESQDHLGLLGYLETLDGQEKAERRDLPGLLDLKVGRDCPDRLVCQDSREREVCLDCPACRG